MGSGYSELGKLRMNLKSVAVVMGGIAANLCEPEWSLKHADCLITGEAEHHGLK